MKSISLLLFSGVFTSLVAEGISISTRWKTDLRTEWLCWCGLFVALSAFRHHSSRSSGGTSSQIHDQPESANTTVSWKLWIAAFFLSVSRSLGLFFETNWLLPFVSSLVYLFLLQKSTGPESVLPIPGAASEQPTKSSSPSWFKAIGMTAVGLCASTLLSFASSAKMAPYIVSIGFVVSRTASFVLLSSNGNYGIRSNDEQSGTLRTIVRLEALAFRVLSITTIFMVVLPPRINLSLAAAGQALILALETAVVLLLILFGCTVSSSTLEAFSTTSVQSLIGTSPQSLTAATVSLVSVVQCLLGLPAYFRSQGQLIVLLLLLPSIIGIIRSIHHFPRPVVKNVPNPPQAGTSGMHPIERLAFEAEAAFKKTLSRQSETLEDAITEYIRRYHRAPPPHFDKWFEAARRQNFVLIDEFDIIMRGLEPFWGVSPSDLRGRVKSAFAAGDRSLIRFEVKGHRASYSMAEAAQWVGSQVRSWFTAEMLDTLSDFVFAVNCFDEPKMVVPHDILDKAIERARNNSVVQPSENEKLGQSVNFLKLGSQNPWDVLVLSCPVESPARQFSKPPSSYTMSELGFLSNVSMSKDVCFAPELRDLHAFLRHPETLNLAHSLFPIFSTAKPSSFQDVLYPAPWYDAKVDMHEYKEQEDMDWEEKEDTLYWVGSTTGGRTTMENWKFFQRQRLGLMVKDKDRTIQFMKKVKAPVGGEAAEAPYTWQAYNSTISEISSSLKVRISSVIQCDDDACKDQEAAFNTSSNRDSLGAGYLSRYNLDIDGNGLSGRYYRLLRSKSAVLKQTILQEWHDDRLAPWVHYIPVNMNLTDLPEMVRYLVHEPEGKELGKKVASNSREWMGKAFRKEDFKLTFWRLLLEYGRIMHDDRNDMKCC
ncbi:hypothetical protein D8B26_006081 [Coccidioides posadasii str. Silveira]|uniref:uncharacterized protein n=1 Tax=Coccidioides posadasii (strain RMSCC 757 / Silveira) TaxID=443226 RepID=UPI001BF086E9|nr:hypothetical protein D8B26_006081 [Coccidioides posadasii str. Silveira]